SPTPFDGLDLFGQNTNPNRTVYVESLAPKLRHGWSPMFAVRGRLAKFIDAPEAEYFDFGSDPKEAFNILEKQPEQAELLRQEIRTLQKTRFGDAAFGNPMDAVLGQESLKKLGELGYTIPKPDPALPILSPTQLTPLYDQYYVALRLLARGKFQDAVGSCMLILSNSPRDGIILGVLSSALGALGHLDEAISRALDAASVQPRERHWLILAQWLLQKKDFVGFEIAMQQMIQIDPLDGEIAILRAQRALMDRQFDQAASLFDLARKNDPLRQGAASQAWLGETKLAQGDSEAARTLYEQALILEPLNVLALQGMAVIERQAGHVDRASEYLKKLCEARPSAVAYANELARLFALLDRREEAIKVMKDFVARNPNDVAGVGNLGNIYVETGNMEDAIVTYRKAMELDPQYAFARFNLAGVLNRVGEEDEAIIEYRKVIEMRPNHKESYKRLLIILIEQSRLDEALADVEQGAKNGGIDWKGLAENEGLDALTGDPRYQEIRSRLEGK
ncbi:MAG: tetratricopeptide repeat protein, partial [Planctomycetota bacterium]